MMHVVRLVTSFEMAFVLFLFAGQFKTDPRLASFPVDLTALFFSLSVLSGLHILFRRRMQISRQSAVIVFLGALYVAYICFSLIWTESTTYSYEKAFLSSTLLLWSLLGTALIVARSVERVQRFLSALLLLSLVFVSEALLTYFDGGGHGFITAFGANYLGVGRMAQFATVLLFCKLLYTPWGITAIGCLIGISGSVWILITGGGRGPLILTGASILFAIAIIWAWRDVLKLNRITTARRLVLVAIVFGIVSFIPVLTGTVTTTTERMDVLFTREDMGTSVAMRLDLQEAAYNQWLSEPVLGIGIGSFGLKAGLVDETGAPHNLVLEILAELGFVGLFLFVILMSYGMYRMYLSRTYPNPRSYLSIVLLFFGVFVANITVMGHIPDVRDMFAFLGLMVLFRPTSDAYSDLSRPLPGRLVARGVHA